MRRTIPKNRIVPLVIFALAGTMISLILVMLYMKHIVNESYNETLQTYDLLSEDTTKQIREGFQEKEEYIQTAANLIGQKGTLDRDSRMEALRILAEDEDYLSMVIVDASGKGINSAGIDVNYGQEQLFQNGMKGTSDITMTMEEGIPALVYSAPIYHQGEALGVLIATQKASLDDLGEISINPNDYKVNDIYIMNERKELVAYQKELLSTEFNYEEITAEGFLFREGERYSVVTGFQLLSNPIGSKLSKVWFHKPLEIKEWTVLIGRSDIIPPVTQNIIRITKLLCVVILIGILLLFLILFIYLRSFNKKMLQMLYLDPVTGGSNWYKFRIDVSKHLDSKGFHKKKFAIVNFDINRFKIINDSFGHQKGDEVLKEIYHLIKKWVRPEEPFTRYSADQFYILMEYQHPEEVSKRILDLNNRLHQYKYTKTVKFYFGVFFITERKDSVDRMGEFASIAKLKIKGSSEEIISFFDDNSRARLLEEEKIEKTMYEALQNNEFMVYLQPKYTMEEEKISGAEALVRWNKEDGSLLSPSFFIPIFEKNGFITELDMYMLRNVCWIQKSWLDKGYRPLPLSVNISRIHFANPNLAEMIKDIVDEYEIPHELVELELSESAFLQNKQMLIGTVTILREYGFVVSMDDFGAGYSSLNSLKDLPLDIVKLDGELFRITDEVERGQTVIRNTISMAKDLHMKVVAECIETREQVEFLSSVGCDIIQGYYYAKPMPVEQFENRYLEQ